MGYQCEILFSKERGRAIQDLVEQATGRPCPCKDGRECPLMPRGEVLLELMVQRPVLRHTA